MKVLILYSIGGSGHESVARVLGEEFGNESGWQTVVDSMASQRMFLFSLFKRGYHIVIKRFPSCWGRVHGHSRYVLAVKFFESILYRLDFFQIKKILRRHHPDVVIATHALALRALAGFKQLHQGHRWPLYAVTTDYWCHPYWAHSHIDGYFAASAQSVQDLRDLGVEREKIILTGLPVSRKFVFNPSLGREPSRKIVVMGGASGIFPFEDFLRIILLRDHLARFEWIFLLGHSTQRDGLDRLVESQCRVMIKIVSYTENVQEYFNGADLLVTKAGAVTLTEAMTAGIPIIISRPIAGQEIGNARILVSQGAALWVDDLRELAERIESLMSPSGQSELRALRAASLALAPKNAAKKIIEHIKERLND